MRGNGKLLYAPLLMALAASLTACASKSTPPAISSPRLPEMPQLSEPLPSEPYSKTVADDIQGWRKRLTGTSTTSER